MISQQPDYRFAYIDSKDNVFFEKDSYFGRFTRAITTLTGFRSYDIPKILKAMNGSYIYGKDIAYLTSKLIKKAGLSEMDFENLQSLSLFYKAHDQTKDTPFSCKEEREALRSFIENSIGNRALNKSLSILLKQTDILPFIHKKALKTLHSFSHKTKNHGKFESAAAKIAMISPHLRVCGLDQKLEDTQKLSHHDLVVMEEMTKLAPIIQDFKRFGFIKSKDSILGALAKHIETTDDFTNKVHEIAERQAPHSKSGTLIFYDVDNSAAKRTPTTRLFDKIVFKGLFRTPIFHASVGYIDDKGHDIEVDVWARFRKSRRSLYSRTFKSLKFNLKKLAGSAETEKQLAELYGKYWTEVIENKISRILRNYYKNSEDFQHLRNPAFRRFLVGIGFRFSPFKYDLRQRAEFAKNNQSVCSEFATKTLVQCFEQLQEEVEKDWNTPGYRREQPAPELSHPIRENRRLHRVTPNDMLGHFIETGFGKETEIAPIIKDIIQVKEYELSTPQDFAKGKRLKSSATSTLGKIVDASSTKGARSR